MRHRAIFMFAGLAALATLGGCVIADDRYGYDTRYDRPYYAANQPRYYAPRDNDWNYRTGTWQASRWDSRPGDRYRRNWDGVDRP